MATKYDAGLYNFDRSNSYHEASLEKGAYLYRLTSVNHSGVRDILSGKGPELSRAKGRFNSSQQKATYCTNNALVCIAEVLYHMYRVVLERMSNTMPLRDIKSSVHAERCLVAVRVKEIKELVYCDCDAIRVDFNARFSGTTVVFPDNTYRPFWDFNDTIRENGKKGVIYPSARHSRDVCLVLFDDETRQIMRNSVHRLNIKLQLLPEDQDPREPPRRIDPYKEKLHATMGYYCFEDRTQYDKARDDRILYPCDIPFQGMIDFVRRRYNKYPDDAVLH